MPYAESHYAEFREAPLKDGLVGSPALFRLSFRAKDFTGTPVEIFPYTDRPVKIDVAEQGGAAGIFQALNPRKLTAKLRAADNWQSTSLYVTDDRQMQVVLLRDLSGTGSSFQTHYQGWVLPAAFVEAYARKPYPVSVSAACGLATLKDRLLLDAAGKRLTGRVSLSHVLRTALAQTGYDLPMLVIDNLYNLHDFAPSQLVNGALDIQRCPLFQTRIDADFFLTEKGTPKTAYEAIREILEPKGLCVTQESGTWVVARRTELAGGWNPSGGATTARSRIYQSTDLTEGPTSNGSAVQQFNYDVYPDLSLRARQGGTVQLSPVQAGIRIEQPYGGFINKLPNGDFSQFDGAGFPAGWIKNNVPATGELRPRVVGTGTELDPYGLFIFGGGDQFFNQDTPYVGRVITYPAGQDVLIPIKRRLTGRFKTVNVRGAKITIVADAFNTATNKTTRYTLQTGGEWKANASKKESLGILIYHTLKNAQGQPIPKPGYADINIDMAPLPGVIRLYILLCAGESLDKYNEQGQIIGPNDGPPTPYVVYENIRLESFVDGLTVSGTQTTIQTRKAKVDTTLTITLGNIAPPGSPAERVATLYDPAGVAISNQNFYPPDATPFVGTDLGKPIIDHLAADYARQLLTPTQSFEDTIFGRLPQGLFTVLRFADLPGAFTLTRWSYYPRECEHELTAVEIKTGTVPAPFKEWQTPDGPVPVEADTATGLPLDPTLVRQIKSLPDRISSAIDARLPPRLVSMPAQAGYIPIRSGDNYLTGTGRVDGVVTGQTKSVLRKLLDLKLPV